MIVYIYTHVSLCLALICSRMYICSMSNQIDILATMPWYVEKVMVYSAPAGAPSNGRFRWQNP